MTMPDETGPRAPDPRMIPPPVAPTVGAGTGQSRARHAGPGPDGSVPGRFDTDELVVRPFLLTGGRTQPVQADLQVETLIQTRPEAAAEQALRFEARQIVERCRVPTSIAELAVMVAVPIGVVRVLVADLVTQGSVVVVEPQEISVQLLERIRDRVRAL